MPKPKHRSFRLTERAVEILAELAESEGCSQTAVVERAVRELRDRLRADPAARALDLPDTERRGDSRDTPSDGGSRQRPGLHLDSLRPVVSP